MPGPHSGHASSQGRHIQGYSLPSAKRSIAAAKLCHGSQLLLMVSWCGAQAPTGPISFEGLYAKLLVYCHDMNLAPSTEGALAATEPDRLPRFACMQVTLMQHTAQPKLGQLSRQLHHPESSGQAKAALSVNGFVHRNAPTKMLRVAMATIAAGIIGGQSASKFTFSHHWNVMALWLAHFAHFDHSIARCRSSVLHSAVGDHVHGSAHLPHHEAHPRVREARRDPKPPELH